MRNSFKYIAKRTFTAMAMAFIVLGAMAPLKVALADTTAVAAGDCTPGAKGCDYQPLTTIPGAFTAGTYTNPVQIVTNIYGVAIGVAAILAVAMITWAGFQYATTEAFSGKSDAKSHWEGAIWGLVILLGSYIMLRTINTDLVNIRLDLGTPLQGQKTSNADAGSLLTKIQSDAKSAAAAYQTSQQTVASAQTSVDALQKQKDDLQKQLESAQSDDYADKVNAINDQIAALDTQLNAANTSLKTAQTTQAVSNLNASAAQGLANVTKYVNEGDVDAAKAMLQTTNDTLAQKVDQITASPDFTEQAKTDAKAQLTVSQTLGSQSIMVSDSLASVKAGISTVNPKTLALFSIRAHQDFLASQAHALADLKSTGASQAVIDDFQAKSLAQFKALDAGLPITQQCPSDNYARSGDSIVCAN